MVKESIHQEDNNVKFKHPTAYINYIKQIISDLKHIKEVSFSSVVVVNFNIPLPTITRSPI